MLQLLKSAVVASALVAGAAHAVVTVTIEAPTVENTTTSGSLSVKWPEPSSGRIAAVSTPQEMDGIT